MDSSTRISDLPDMSSRQSMPQFSITPDANSPIGIGVGGNPDAGNTSYMPMNIHPNPYGNQPPTSVLPPPQQTQSPPKLNSNSLMFPAEMAQNGMPANMGGMNMGGMNMGGMNGGGMNMGQQPQYPLPSRDIPQDLSIYSVDEAIQPNYIPKPTRTNYIREDTQEEEEERLRLNKKKEKRVRFVDDMFVDIQKPVIIALLFLLFQLPFMNAFLYKYLFFLKLAGEDGNMNMWGFVFKSAVFGVLVYGLDYLMNVLSD